MEVLSSLIENPELAGKISLNIGANDLINFAREIVNQSKPETIPATPAEKYLTADETADLLKVSRVTLWQWQKKGVLVPRKIGNVLRYTDADVKQALQGRS